jgi:hypothetical protein
MYSQDIESIIAEYNSDYTDFLEAFSDGSIEDLILSKSFPSSLPKDFLIDQLISYKKVQQKIPSWASIKGLVYPPPIHVEQSSSEWTATYKAKLVETEIIIDGTGGMGVDSYFFAKRGMKLWYVESNEHLSGITQNNFTNLGIDATLITGRLEDFLASPKFEDLRESSSSLTLFIDPSRRVQGNKVAGLADSEPNMFRLWDRIVSSVDQLIVKASPMAHVEEVLAKEYSPDSIHAVSVNNELKELLYHYRFKPIEQKADNEGKIWYKSVDIRKNESVEQGQHSFAILADKQGLEPVSVPYIQSELLTSICTITNSTSNNTKEKGSAVSLNSYLYDPMVGAKKLACMDHIALKYGLMKLNTHTHLYFSTDLVEYFPGRIFEILDGFSPSHKFLKKWIKANVSKYINIWTLNYPLSSQAIKKKYGIQDGGELTLIFTRIYPDQHWVFVVKRVTCLS